MISPERNPAPSSRGLCLVVGVGKAGLAHLAVLQSLIPGRCVGWAPTDRHADAVRQLGVPFFSGSLQGVVLRLAPSHVVIATPVETLATVARQVIGLGIKQVLLEKPGALSRAEALSLADLADHQGARVVVGFNRRWYGSVLAAERILQSLGDRISQVHFDFSEPIDQRVGREDLCERVTARLVVTNSLHVIDLALYPVGLPLAPVSDFRQRGSLPWHPSGSSFTGAGTTQKNKSFTYHADWTARARWKIEWTGEKLRCRFQPLESLWVQRLPLNRNAWRKSHSRRLQRSLDFVFGRASPRRPASGPPPGCPSLHPRQRAFRSSDNDSFSMRSCLAHWEPVPDDAIDRQFKPGFYRQSEAFLRDESRDRFPDLREAAELIELACRIGGYPLAEPDLSSGVQRGPATTKKLVC